MPSILAPEARYTSVYVSVAKHDGAIFEVIPSPDPDPRMPVIIAGLDGISGVSAWSFRLRDALRGHPRYRVLLVNCRVTGNNIGRFDHVAASQETMRALLRECAPAIVVPNFIWSVFDVCAELIAEGVPLRCVGYCRADSDVEYYNPLTWYAPLITGFAAVSPECASHLARLLPDREGDIAVIPTGVVVPPALDRPFQTAPLRLVYGGRIVQAQKRVLDFVPLVEVLIARSCDFVFDIAGQGRQLGELKGAMARLDHGGRVRFLGKCAPVAMDAVWREHDVFIQVSEFEGTSNSMLEAMAQGAVPVITQTASGVQGVIEHGVNGILVPLGDSEALAGHLCDLANDSVRLEAMGRAAHETAKRYAIAVCAARFVALLDQIASSPLRPWPESRNESLRPVIEGLDLPKLAGDTTPAGARVGTTSVVDDIPPDFATPETLVLAVAADENFVMPLAAMIRSVLCNLAASRRVLLYVIDGDIEDASKARLIESWDSHRLLVRWCLPTLSLFEDMKVSGHVNVLTYARLLIQELLPTRHAKAIYLDCDIIVLGDLAEVWDHDPGTSHLLAVQDMTAPYMSSASVLENMAACAPYLSAAEALTNFRDLGIAPDRKYFNAGLMLVNLGRWRATDTARAVTAYLRDHAAHIRWWDQDGLNAVLHDSWGELDLRWNQIPHIFRYPSWRESPFGERDYAGITTAPKAVHYAARSKPWHGDHTHPFRDVFFQYLDQTAWEGWRPEVPRNLVRNGNFAQWDDNAPTHWSIAEGSVVGPSNESRMRGLSVCIHPRGDALSAMLAQSLPDMAGLAGARLAVSMDARCEERHALALDVHLKMGDRSETFRAEHPGHGAWATMRHEIDIAAECAPDSIRCLIELRAGASSPVVVENVRVLVYPAESSLAGVEWRAPKAVDLRKAARRRAWAPWIPTVWVRSAQRSRRRRALHVRAQSHGVDITRSPMFSVVLSNYNGAEYLEEALLSVAQQDFAPFEFIVIDDGSTDASREIIERIAGQYPSLISTHLKSTNEGQAAGFNDGFQKACGDIVCFIDSDDCWFPDKLAKLARMVEADPGCAIYQHNLFKFVDGVVTSEKFRDVVYTGDLLGYTQRTRHFPYFVPTTGLAFSRDALEHVMPIPVEFRVCADGFLTRTALCFGPIASSNECWGAYRVHGGNNVFENPEHDGFAYANGLLIPTLNAFYQANGIDLSFEVKPFRKSSSGLAPRVRATNRSLVTKILDSSIRELLREARRRIPFIR